MDVDADASGNLPATPYTQRDLEWRGLRSAAPTPDTAAIGRRFSFPWRNSSQEIDEENEDEDEDADAGAQLNNNTKANASRPDTIAEEDEEEAEAENDPSDQDMGNEADANSTPIKARKGKAAASTANDDDDADKEESEFAKWFWENRGDNNRAWKKRRRETLKTKRLRDNRKLTSGRKVG